MLACRSCWGGVHGRRSAHWSSGAHLPATSPGPQLRCYRLLDFFSFLTYSLATPLLFVTLLRNILVSCRGDWVREAVRMRETAAACTLSAPGSGPAAGALTGLGCRLRRLARVRGKHALSCHCQMTFYIANFEACLFYYLARQVGGRRRVLGCAVQRPWAIGACAMPLRTWARCACAQPLPAAE